MQIDKIAESEVQNHGDELKRFIYNPNEIDSTQRNLMSLFKSLADTIIVDSSANESLDSSELHRKAQKKRDKYQNIFSKVLPIDYSRFKEILIKNSKRYRELPERQPTQQCFHDIENVINAVCHPKTIENACLLYLQQIKNEIIH